MITPEWGFPETRAINPFSNSDWAVSGAEPDVKVKAAEALVREEQVAQINLQKKSTDNRVLA